jgi:hypothetical protein
MLMVISYLVISGLGRKKILKLILAETSEAMCSARNIIREIKLRRIRVQNGSGWHPIEWVPGALSLRVKWPGRETDHSRPSSAEVKNAWSYTPLPSTPL